MSYDDENKDIYKTYWSLLFRYIWKIM